MAELRLHGDPVNSVFQLLGDKENDITYSMGWALAKCRPFLNSFVKNLVGETVSSDGTAIFLQQHVKSGGFTDIEIKSSKLYLIIEAKRGWNLPDHSQLLKYAERFRTSNAPTKMMVVLSECSTEYSAFHLPATEIDGIPVQTVSWRDVARTAKNSQSMGSHAEKRLITEFLTYMSGVTRMQNLRSNLVYVVSLARGTPAGWGISWIEIVNKRKKYFHAVGVNGWPKEPPNYIAFRYNGKLQSVHHVEDYLVFTDVSEHFPEINKTEWTPNFLYSLGPAMKPNKEVRTGKIYPNGRVWCMLDTLFTCDTIAEARDISKLRIA